MPHWTFRNGTSTIGRGSSMLFLLYNFMFGGRFWGWRVITMIKGLSHDMRNDGSRISPVHTTTTGHGLIIHVVPIHYLLLSVVWNLLLMLLFLKDFLPGLKATTIHFTMVLMMVVFIVVVVVVFLVRTTLKGVRLHDLMWTGRMTFQKKTFVLVFIFMIDRRNFFSGHG